MIFSLTGAADWPIVGQICWLLGKVMNFIYTLLKGVLGTDAGIVGLSIVVYTILVYTLMMPLTIKQQRASKMTSVMNPELQKIQKKYRNKRDQASQLKMQEEMQCVYDKYGVSMMGGCLPMLIQMPLLFALYPVIYDIEHYVPAMAHDPESVNRFLSIPDLTISPWTMLKNSGDFGTPAIIIIITAIALPVLSGLSQYLSIRLSQAISGQQMDQDNPMAGTMKSMNIMMPLFSVYIVFTLPTGIGLYWIVSAVVRCIQQVMINKHLSKMSVEDILEENREKAEEKAKKRGEKAEKIAAMAQTNTKSIKEAATQSVSGMSEKEREAKIEKAKKNAAGAEAGSLAAKANMVKKFNENN